MDLKELSDYTLKLDRSFFIDGEYKLYADYDGPLPIGHGQTISQPSLVFEMTFLLSPERKSKVLEIGTGSGYQTAILAEFSDSVYTVERIPELSEKARERLDHLGYSNIRYRVGDGSEGWAENAPYDRIMVTAAAESIPLELLEQLECGGSMIIPVGPSYMQELKLVDKDLEGKISIRSVGEVRFVELKGKYGWSLE